MVVDCQGESDTKTRIFTPKNCGSKYKVLCGNWVLRYYENIAVKIVNIDI